ncbi:MAG: Na/Pi cotransporter family protein [Rhodospirillales bacterium]
MLPPLELLHVVIGFAGGLALFLFGMGLLSDGLKAVTGDRLRALLAGLTANRLIAVFTGAFVTAVIQSSSVTTVLVVGFVSAGLITLTQSIGVIVGANIGSTFTAQVIAFNITDEALLIVAAGFALSALARHETVRQTGRAVLGLGLVFFGMALMGEAVAPLRASPSFVDAVTRLQNPLVGIVVGAVSTALIQSSAATTGLVIVLAAQGLLSLAAGIAIVLGANVGTCVTALLAAIGRPREALQAAVVHVIFNLAGVLLWVGFIDQLAALTTAVSPTADHLDSVSRRAAEVPRQIANAHTLFNVANTLLFIGFTGAMARLVRWLVPDRPATTGGVARPRYLDDQLLGTPTMALHAARLEIAELGGRVRAMLAAILPAVLTGSHASLQEIARMDVGVDALHREVIGYLRRLGLRTLTAAEGEELVRLMDVANAFEHIGDIMETDLVTLGERRLEERILVSDSTAEVIAGFHAAVDEALGLAIAAVGNESESDALRVIAMKPRINALADEAGRRGARRLVSQHPERLRAYTREMEMIEKLKRIFYFAKRIAKAVAPRGDASAAGG